MQNDLIYDVDFTDVNNYVVSDLRIESWELRNNGNKSEFIQ
jgi:hypothetical protein